MLREIRNVRQIPGDGRRRWFQDTYFDLIVWYDDDGGMTGFQLCYDKKDRERAFTWRRGQRCIHEEIDAGEQPGHAKMTPVLQEAPPSAEQDVPARFFHESALMEDRGIVRLVYEKIEQCLADVGTNGKAAGPGRMTIRPASQT